MKQTIYIQGMTCGSCVQKIKDLFKSNFNISDIEIDKDSGKVEYEHDIFLTNPDILKALEWTKYSMADSRVSSFQDDIPIHSDSQSTCSICSLRLWYHEIYATLYGWVLFIILIL